MTNLDDKTRDLGQRIRAQATSGEPLQETLDTSQRIIARVTDGIYREPWAAFRELIANSYDADATRVVIETDAPSFTQITVRDDGNGMSTDTVAYILKHIGGSSKRTSIGEELHTVAKSHVDESPGGRPLIGKIGIGLFSVAQLTQHFQIITKHRDEDLRTSATVLLTTHSEDRLKTAESAYTAGTVIIKTERVAPADAKTHGTTIVLYSLRPEIRRVLQSARRWQAVLTSDAEGRSLQDRPKYHIGMPPRAIQGVREGIEPELPWKDGQTPADRFAALMAAAKASPDRSTRPANLEHFDEYLRLIWKLSLSLPLKYIDAHPFDLKGGGAMLFYGIPEGKGQAYPYDLGGDESLRDRLQLRAGIDLQENPFEVEIDGVLLRRPIHLDQALHKPSRVPGPVMLVGKEVAPFGPKEIERAGGELEFEAYLYWNSKLVPKDTAGALIRVREASGTLFDQRFLNYQVSEQTRLGQITAEIFVRKGLDGAINIDRESFNFSHPHFLYIQRWVHKALRLLVNRLKSLADEDLRAEKAKKAVQAVNATRNAAIRVWTDRLGAEADLPLNDSVAGEVGGAEVAFDSPVLAATDQNLLRSLAIVLEAYGVLSRLKYDERHQLLSDILRITRNPL